MSEHNVRSYRWRQTAAWSSIGGALVGIVAFLSAACAVGEFWILMMEPTSDSDEDMQAMAGMIVFFGTIFSTFVGGVIGLVCSPVFAWMLRRTEVKLRAVTALLAITVVPTSLWAYFQPFLFGVTAIIPAVAFLSLSCAVYGARYRRLHRPGHCPECLYDLQDRVQAGCPECGWGRE